MTSVTRLSVFVSQDHLLLLDENWRMSTHAFTVVDRFGCSFHDYDNAVPSRRRDRYRSIPHRTVFRQIINCCECSTQVEIRSGHRSDHELAMTCNSCLHEAARVRILLTLVEVLHFPTASQHRTPRRRASVTWSTNEAHWCIHFLYVSRSKIIAHTV